MVDKKLIASRFSSHMASYAHYATVQNEICARLALLLKQCTEDSNLRVRRALEVGAGTGFLTSRMFETYGSTRWFVNDITTQSRSYIEEHAVAKRAANVEYLWGDAESIELPSNLDLVVSSSAMQWFESVERFVSRLDVRQKGVVAFSSFGPKNFIEMREATGGYGLDYPTLQEFEAQISKSGYKPIITEEYTSKLWFSSAVEVLHHIKNTGVNALSAPRWQKADLQQFIKRYENFSQNNKVPLTYHPLIVIAEKP